MSTESADLAPAVRDLLVAIRDHIDVPRPADIADDATFDQLQRTRVMSVLGMLDVVLDVDNITLTAAAEALRIRIQQLPVTYRPCEPEATNSPVEVTP